MRGRTHYLLCCLGLLALVISLQAQTVASGSITGVISDDSNSVVAGASVALTSVETGLNLASVTNAQGAYTFTNLEPATYAITAERTGFSPKVVNGIRIAVAQNARIDIRLTIGSVAEKVEVTASAGVVETENPTLSAVINHKQITELPFNGRYSIAGLIALAPGVQNSGSFASGGFAKGGLNVTVDGATNLDMQNGTRSEATPPFDAIEEFRFISNSASAEYTSGSSQLVLVTRSGTNDLHGSAFWFNRNRLFAAKYILDHRDKPPFNRNEFGGTAGGPIKKDKLFYFASFEQLSQRTSTQATFNMPTAAMKLGDFTGLGTISDPLNGNQPFASNKIDPSRISPVAKSIMKYIEDPNLPGSGPAGTGVNLVAAPPTIQDSPRFTGKVDYRPTSNNMIAGGFKMFNDGPYLRGNGTDLNGSYTQGFKQRQANGSWTRILSPQMTNELQGAFTTYGYHLTDANNAFDPGSILPALDGQCCADKTSVDKSKAGRFGGGLPTITLNGYYGVTNQAQTKDNRHDLNISNNLAYIKGPHQLKFGGYFYRYQGYWGGMYNTGAGLFNFTGRYSGDAFADFLLGYANTSTRGPAYQFGDFNEKRLGGFVQDDWQVSRRLTVNLGLRWDVETPFVEKKLRQANYDPQLNALVTYSGNDQYPPEVVNSLLGYPVITSTQAGLGTTKYTRNINWRNLQPRVGFAFRPFNDNKTVVRAGAGVYYAYESSNQLGLRQVLYAPFALVETFNAAPGATPTVTFANPFPGSASNPSAPAVLGYPRDYPDPKSYQWNVTIEREVIRNTSLRISYVGNRTTNASQEYDLNTPRDFGPGNLQALRPSQPWGEIRWVDPRGNAITHQLQIGSQRRSGDLTYAIEYQYTSALSDGAGANVGWGSTGSLDWPFDSRRNWGKVEGIQGQRVVGNWVYDMPFGKDKRFFNGVGKVGNLLVGGWQFTGIGTIASGTPFNVTYTSRLVGFPVTGRADIIGNSHVNNPGVNGWFNTAAFAEPDAFTLGNSGRNNLWGPGMWNFDAGLMKNIKFGERFSTQLRTEWFNAFNHANPANPGASLATPSTFGKITSFSTARVILFGLKLAF
jgi:hypothetical protein